MLPAGFVFGVRRVSSAFHTVSVGFIGSIGLICSFRETGWLDVPLADALSFAGLERNWRGEAEREEEEQE